MKINLKSFVFIFFFMQVCIYCKPQHPFYHQYNADEGLPSNEVYRIIQDSKGYLWIGCDAGIYRYDGISYKSYKHSAQNSRSMSNLHIDKNGLLWCSNFSGQIFYIEKDTLRLSKDLSEVANRFQVFFSDNSGYYIFDKSGLSWYNKQAIKHKQWKASIVNDKYINASTAIFSDREIWIETPMGLYYGKRFSDSLKLILPADAPGGYQTQRVFKYKNQYYLFRSEHPPSDKNYFYILNNQKAEMLYSFSSSQAIRYYYFYEDRQSNLWIGTSRGVWRINYVKDFLFSDEKIFPLCNISSIYQDREGNYWFTTLQQGLFMMPYNTTFFYDDKGPIKINNDITALAVSPSNKLFVGHHNGDIGIVDISNNQSYYPQSLNKHQGLSVKDIEFDNQQIFISRGRLFLFDEEKEQVLYPFPYGNVRDLLIIRDTVYAMHADCVVRFPIQGIKHNYPLRPDTISKVGGRKLLYEAKTNLIYLALNNGLYGYKNNHFFPILLHDKKIYAHTLVCNHEFVFAGTQADGLMVLKNGKIVDQLLINEFIEDKTPKALACNNNYVWICTYSDLFRYDILAKKLEKYSRNIGVNPKDVTTMIYHKGNVYIGTKKHLHRINVSESPVNHSIPEIYLSKVKLDDNEVNDSLLQLPYNFNYLRFEFISFSYRSQADFYYEYRLLGLDSSWIRINYASPSAIFNSLPGGSYVFQVRSVNESGISSLPVQYAFSVAFPPWQTWWFYLIVTFTCISLIYWGFRIRLRLLEKKAENEKRLIHSQLAALKAQMNPHFMYNALNSIQALILQNDIKNSNLYLGKFSSLMRKVLDASGKEKISLKEETDILNLYLDLEKLRFGNEFIYTIQVHKDIDEYTMFLPSMILQPLVENALKHGLLHKRGIKKLSIAFELMEQKLICTITDNGIGRQKSNEINQRMRKGHASFATQATDKRLELLNLFEEFKYQVVITDLFDEKKTPSGTQAMIIIPQ